MNELPDLQILNNLDANSEYQMVFYTIKTMRIKKSTLDGGIQGEFYEYHKEEIKSFMFTFLSLCLK